MAALDLLLYFGTIVFVPASTYMRDRILELGGRISARLRLHTTIAVGVLSVVLLTNVGFAYANEQNRKYESIQHQMNRQVQDSQKQIEQTKQEIQKKDTELKTINEQLQQKNQESEQLKKDNEKLKTDLQAKRDHEARVAAAVQFKLSSTGGRGGAASEPRGNSAGNGYDYGWCTWYVKERRPDLPNNLGNANTWFARAQAQGLPVGYTPRAGAVGQTSGGSLGHVVYVERVNGDGTIYISEMNYQGWGVKSFRTANASEFRYIY